MGELCALGSAVSWAISGILLKPQTERLGAVLLNAWRSLIAALFFFALLPFFGGLEAIRALPLAAWIYFLASVVFVLGIGDTLYLKSLTLVGVARALPLVSTTPLFTLVLAIMFLSESLTLTNIAGIVVVVLGIILISSLPGQERSAANPDDQRGVLLALAAAAFWGAGSAVMKPALEGTNPVVANSIRQPLTALLLFAVSAHSLGTPRLPRYNGRDWLALLAASLVSSGLSSLLYLWGIQFAGAARGASLASTAPLFAVLLSATLLKERVTARIAFGAALTVAGIWLII